MFFLRLKSAAFFLKIFKKLTFVCMFSLKYLTKPLNVSEHILTEVGALQLATLQKEQPHVRFSEQLHYFQNNYF